MDHKLLTVVQQMYTEGTPSARQYDHRLAAAVDHIFEAMSIADLVDEMLEMYGPSGACDALWDVQYLLDLAGAKEKSSRINAAILDIRSDAQMPKGS